MCNPCITPSGHLYWRSCDQRLWKIDPIAGTCQSTGLSIRYTRWLIADALNRIYCIEDGKFHCLYIEQGTDFLHYEMIDIPFPFDANKGGGMFWNDDQWNIYLWHDQLYLLQGETFVPRPDLMHKLPKGGQDMDSYHIVASSNLELPNPVFTFIHHDMSETIILRYRSENDISSYSIVPVHGTAIHPGTGCIYMINEVERGHSELSLYIYPLPSLIDLCVTTIKRHFSDSIEEIHKRLPQELSERFL